MIKLYFCLLVIELRIDLTFYKSITEKFITMSIKGKCAIYIDKNLRFMKTVLVYLFCDYDLGMYQNFLYQQLLKQC